MFRLNQDALKTKTDAQLKALFQETTREAASTPRFSAAFCEASANLRMIRSELARRYLKLG